MCGIFAVISNNFMPVKDLVRKLAFLEYRGYDSVGLYYNDKIIKCKGDSNNLKTLVNMEEVTRLSLGHTRWATHGAPSNENAHPHQSIDGNRIMIHNGIVENWTELREKIDESRLTSETDTEVLVNYIQGVMMNTILRDVEGSFSFVVYDKQNPNRLMFLKKGIPLYVGTGESRVEISSDIKAFSPEIETIHILRDESYGEIIGTNCYFYKNNINYVPKTVSNNQVRLDNTLNGYPHFMLKEINEIPDHREIGYDNPITFSDIDNIVIGACGSSLYAGHYGKLLIEEHLDIPVSLEIASEYIYKRAPIPKNSMYIFISQSGETADTIAMCKKVKHRATRIISICNSHGSTITRLTDANVFINVGIECGVAATKSFIGQMMAFHKLINNGAYLYGIGSYLKNYTAEAQNSIRDLALRVKDSGSLLLMGRGYNFPIAQEGALKIKEIAYIHCEGFSASEMKHGVISLINSDLPVIYMIPRDRIHAKNRSNLEELRARGANLVVLEGDSMVHDSLYAFKYVIFFQLLSYYVGTLRGNNVDRPRNLAKSVTVE